MAEFRIGQFRYTWKGPWITGTSYKRDDIVSYGGSSFVCIVAHVAQADFYDDLNYLVPGETAQTPRWVSMTETQASWAGAWSAATQYNIGDVLNYGGYLWICIRGHLSQSTFDANILDWEVFAYGVDFKGDWQEATRYGIGDVVNYGGNTYRCILGHTSGTAAEGVEVGNNDDTDDSTLETWTPYYEGIEYRGEWASETRYRKDDLVSYNGSLLRCLTGHTSLPDDEYEEEFWQVELYGNQFDQEWTQNIYYGIGSVVRYGGFLFYAVRASYNKFPIDSVYNIVAPEDYWVILSKGSNFRGEWSQDELYKMGDVVRRGGNLYVAILDTVSDASTLDYLDVSNWELLVPGSAWKAQWSENRVYFVGDMVIFEGDVYTCNFGHDSSSQNYPGDNGSGFEYWDMTIESLGKQGMRSRGDLLTYDLSRGLAGDESTQDITRVPVGAVGQVLQVNGQGSVDYSDKGFLARTFFVDANTGVDDADDPLRGVSEYFPWRTVRFACERANDGWEGTTTVSVATGYYEEVLPIIIPKRTAVKGAELRSTVIVPKPANPALAGDYIYSIRGLQRVSTMIGQILSGITPTKTVGNPENPVVSLFKTVTDTVITVDPDTLEETTTTVERQVLVAPSVEAIANIETLIIDVINYIEFRLADGTQDVTVFGTNAANTDEGYTDAVLLLNANKNFLAAEASAYVSTTWPSFSFNSAACQRDVKAYIDAWAHDIIYTGCYRTVLAARYYVNAVNGSEREDMFYLRDATGLRNCTIRGLTGALNPPGTFDLYQRPTGGSFCSLDPGWGPDHQETWIMTRSPYIQGVTTIGDNCIGQKIDGSLHNGGNKSMVSNDFTQVLSDGIGAWVSNNGRAELVSVFTYYCAIGYLADNGGVIRATNGNCSYGKYGAISDGIDITEVPQSTRINNRNNEAQVLQTFAGEFNDEIYALEYSNAGQNYTSATATIIGSGVGASVKFEDFRDNALSQARLLDISTTIAEQIGGSGYSVAQNNAQPNLTPGGDAYSITLATSDSNTAADYVGKRILITGGTGTGQYGYIYTYDSFTKVATVRRESDDAAGWDHIVSGTPLKVPFDTTTQYRIEPRVIFSDPEFITTAYTATANTIWSAATYGETYEIFSAVSSTFNEGDDSSLNPTGALFLVRKVGREYELSLQQFGSGYSVGDLLIIAGDQVGGTTPENDIYVRVTGATEDSTRSLVSFTHTGIASSGKFVFLSQGGAAGVASTDGENWNEPFLMPVAGDWQAIASVTEKGDSELNGYIRFVAIRNDSDQAASSFDGENWTLRTMPSSQKWNDVAYGEGRFVAVSGTGNVSAYSTNGTSWTEVSMPAYGDSTDNEYVGIAYGKNKWIALANSNNVVAESNDGGLTWQGHVMDVIDDSTQKDWVSIAYGHNKFVAISSQGDLSYSFNGEVWYPGTLPTQDGSTAHNWKQIKFGNGLFFAVGDTGGRNIYGDPVDVATTFAATSEDGVIWRARTFASSQEWQVIAHGSPYVPTEDSSVGLNTPIWVAAPKNNQFLKIRAGVRAKGRVVVGAGIIGTLKILDPGSGYIDAPTVEIVDPNVSIPATFEMRMGDGVLAQPTWLNKGTGYRTATTRVTISGDGFADIIPAGKFLTIDGLDFYPGPGAQLVINNGEELLFTVVQITELGTLNGPYEGFSAYLRVSPDIKNRMNLVHGTQVIVRSRYSQNRITGHDFLDVGTGNFEQTNYPELYSQLYQSAPENETYEEDGGRVFYTSTDQSGNFRCGELFGVEQATGVVTISADFFDFSGLTELRLGGIRVGGTGAVIREFSTDPTFTEDSNNIVPTQRAIASYLENRLSVGGSEIATASFIAGLTLVGPNLIRNTLGGTTIFKARAEFEGSDVEGNPSQVQGSIIAQTLFNRTVDPLENA